MGEDERRELEKCKNDIVYFVEKYMTYDGKPMVLNDSEKEFLRTYHGRLNNSQLQLVLTGFRFGERLANYSTAHLTEFLEKFPKKETDEVFTWELQKLNYE